MHRHLVHVVPAHSGGGEPSPISARPTSVRPTPAHRDAGGAYPATAPPPRPPADTHRRDVLADLRAQVRALELGEDPAVSTAAAVPLGVDAIDQTLPWGGLPRGALHVVAPDASVGVGGDGSAAASGFAAALIGRLSGAGGRALWCLRRGDLYAPGLAAFGVDPDRLVVVRARRAEDVLWTLEEALASGRFAAVLGEGAEANLTASRRLQLAARGHGVACLLLDRGEAPAVVTAGVAVTRWLIAPAPGAASLGGAPAAAGWRITLARCRGGAVPRHWTMGWCHETRGFLDPAILADRPRPVRAGAQGVQTLGPQKRGPAPRPRRAG